jgi:hypothetical protein
MDGNCEEEKMGKTHDIIKTEEKNTEQDIQKAKIFAELIASSFPKNDYNEIIHPLDNGLHQHYICKKEPKKILGIFNGTNNIPVLEIIVEPPFMPQHLHIGGKEEKPKIKILNKAYRKEILAFCKKVEEKCNIEIEVIE